MYDSSGGDEQSRREEARRILDMLEGCEEQLPPKERDYILQLRINFEKYGDRTRISPKQLFWLRDIKDNL